jgi:RNA polymerase sigma-70 factor (ECF subfamily)
MTPAALIDYDPDLPPVESDAASAEAEIRAGLEHEREPLMRYALSRTGRYAEAEDLVQETMMRALRFASSYRPGTHLRGWLKTILRNSWINRGRAAAIRPKTLATDEAPRLFSAVPDRSVAVEPVRSDDFLARRDEVDDRLHAAIARLSPEHRDVLLLSALDGYSHREIAERLEIPEGTVMSRLFRARKAARGHLAA